VTADEVGEGKYFCQDCDSNFVADIRSKRSVPPKPTKRPPRPSRASDKKKKGGVGDSSKKKSELPDPPGHVSSHSDADSDTDSSEASKSVHGAQTVDEGDQLFVLGNRTNQNLLQPYSSSLHFENAEQRPFVEPCITHISKNDMYAVIRERLHFLNLHFSVMEESPSGMQSPVYFSILKSLSDIRSFCITANEGSFMQDEEELYPFGFNVVHGAQTVDEGDQLFVFGNRTNQNLLQPDSSGFHLDHTEQRPFVEPLMTQISENTSVRERTWALPHSIDESPKLNSQLMLECETHMNHAWNSLRSRCWGLGNEQNYKELPESWFTSALISQCFNAFSFFARDIFFIDPDYCDFILLNADSGSWNKAFLRNAQISKFNFVVAFVSLQSSPTPQLRTSDRGHHWIVLVGDLEKSVSWVYDPADSSLDTESYEREYEILARFMRAVRPLNVPFVRQKCPFLFQCQNVSKDGENCGLWCVFYTMNMCLGTLSEYESLCKQNAKSKGLPTFASELRKHLYSDIVRHRNLLDMSFVDMWQSPNIDLTIFSPPITSFWTFTPVNFLDYCQMRFNSRFREINPKTFESVHPAGHPPFPPRGAIFFTDGNFVIKVYRFLWGKVSLEDLGQALHETAATAYVCERTSDYFIVFGVVTTGICATYVNICVCRNVLVPANLSLNCNPFLNLYQKTGVAHGDGHSGNVMLTRFTKSKTECIDFERSFLPLSEFSKEQIINTITSYYSAITDADRSNILKSEIDKQGLSHTRSNFRQFAKKCLKTDAPRDLFCHDIQDFLRLFTRAKQ
jgi:hypothetical protein